MCYKKTIAIIPARGGSKRLPRKNILELEGKPLIVHSIEFALKERSIDEVWVSTDSKEIAKISKRYGAGILERPAFLASDDTLTNEVIQYHAKNFFKHRKDIQWICILQPTNPARPNKLISDALEKIEQEDRNSLACFSPLQKKFGRIEQQIFIPENYKFGQRSQDIEERFYENGLLYIVEFKLARNGIIFSQDVYPFVINSIHGAVDIDTKEDFEFARIVLQFLKNKSNTGDN